MINRFVQQQLQQARQQAASLRRCG